MNKVELIKLENLQQEAEEAGDAFRALASDATPGSESAKQFKKLADDAFIQAEKYFQESRKAYRAMIINH